MFNLIIMFHEKVSLGTQSHTSRTLTLYADRVTRESQCAQACHGRSALTTCHRSLLWTQKTRQMCAYAGTYTFFRGLQTMWAFWSSYTCNSGDKNGVLCWGVLWMKTKTIVLSTAGDCSLVEENTVLLEEQRWHVQRCLHILKLWPKAGTKCKDLPQVIPICHKLTPWSATTMFSIQD